MLTEKQNKILNVHLAQSQVTQLHFLTEEHLMSQDIKMVNSWYNEKMLSQAELSNKRYHTTNFEGNNSKMVPFSAVSMKKLFEEISMLQQGVNEHQQKNQHQLLLLQHQLQHQYLNLLKRQSYLIELKNHPKLKQPQRNLKLNQQVYTVEYLTMLLRQLNKQKRIDLLFIQIFKLDKSDMLENIPLPMIKKVVLKLQNLMTLPKSEIISL